LIHPSLATKEASIPTPEAMKDEMFTGSVPQIYTGTAEGSC